MAKRKATITETLRAAIKASGQTHYRLAKQTGIAPAMLDRFVKAERDIRGITIDKLAEVLELELTRRK